MVWSDLLNGLRSAGLDVTESQVRWALKTDKINRPPLDGSLRYVFNDRHLRQLKVLFEAKRQAEADRNIG